MKAQRIFGFALTLALVLSLFPVGITNAASSSRTRIALTSRGVASFHAAAIASQEVLGNLPNTLKSQFGSRYEFDIPRTANTASMMSAMTAQSTPAALDVPEADSYKVITRVPKDVNRWNGISHLEQRLANNGNQWSTEPPDQALCVGGGFVVEAVNLAMAIYNTQGKKLEGVTDLNTFFGYPAAIDRTTGKVGPFIADPKCLYDASTHRWFLSVLVIDQDTAGNFTGTTHVDIAVSQVMNPTRDWTLYSLDTTDGDGSLINHSGCPCVGDQPLISFNSDAFFISTNEFPLAFAGFNGAQVYVIPKSLLVEGKPASGFHFDNLLLEEGQAYSLQPAVPGAPADLKSMPEGAEYFLSALDFFSTLDNRIALWVLNGTDTLLSSNPELSLDYKILKSETYGLPPNAEQKVGNYPLGQSFGEPENLIETNDDRMNQVEFANGRLYGGLNTILNVDEAKRAGIAYFVVAPRMDDGRLEGKIDDQGYVAVEDNNVFFPSIAAAPGGRPLIVFSLSGKDYFPSAAFTTLGSHTIVVTGEGREAADGFSGYPETGAPMMGIERWGDYSAAVTDGSSVWMAAEYIPGGERTVNANWGTLVFEVK